MLPSASGVIRIEREVELEGMLSPEHFEQVVEAIQAVMKMPGHVSAIGNKLTWTPGGAMLEPSVTVRSKEGRTFVRYVETHGNSRHMKVGFGVLSGLAAVFSGTTVTFAGVAIAKAADVSRASGAPIVLGAGALFALATAVGSYVGLRRPLARRWEVRSRFADEVVFSVTRAVEESLAARVPKARVDASAAHGEADAEAELVEDTEEVARVERRS